MIVLAVGCFDLIHVAHKRHLEQASQWGTLVVGVTKDSGVNKKGRPIIPEMERLEMVKALKSVADGSLCFDSIDALRTWEPDIFVKGSDYRKKGLLDSELAYCKQHGIEVRFTNPNPQTTTGIIEDICSLQTKN
jgi:cytidyltransferase-like protein